jgi:exosortase
MNYHRPDPKSSSQVVGRTHLIFGAFVLVVAGFSWRILTTLVTYSLKNESCSHIILIPFVTAFLLFLERERIFGFIRPSILAGLGVISVGALFYWLGYWNVFSLPGNGPLSITAIAFVFCCIGGFLMLYGVSATRAALFPLLFLLLMVPLPDAALAWAIHLLQQGSTDLTCLLFKFFGVPFLRQGFVIALPSVTIEVAAECSGIRSSIALFITCLLVAHLYLRTPWKILLFLLVVFPLTVVKNAIRIVTLTLLSIHVNPGFLYGRLHHQGGVFFFLISLLLLLPVFLALERSERKPVPLNAEQPAG